MLPAMRTLPVLVTSNVYVTVPPTTNCAAVTVGAVLTKEMAGVWTEGTVTSSEFEVIVGAVVPDATATSA